MILASDFTDEYGLKRIVGSGLYGRVWTKLLETMLVYEELSNKILEAYFNVFKHLTTGLLESVYENALCIEFDEMGILYERQKHLSVFYKGNIIGEFIPDIVVDNKVILELKSIPSLTPANSAQLINYLTITHYKVGYLLNFGEARDYKRILNTKSPF